MVEDMRATDERSHQHNRLEFEREMREYGFHQDQDLDIRA
jgi:hypothetical protein